VVPNNPTITYKEQAVNHVIMLKQFVNEIPAVCEALTGATSELLKQVVEVRCASSVLLKIPMSNSTVILIISILCVMSSIV